MTIEEMHASILLKVDRVGSYSTANLIPGEIDDFLNEAIRDFVNRQKRYLREELSVNQSSKAQENLHTLIKSTTVSNVSSHPVFDNVSTIALSDLNDYDYFISGRADFDGSIKILKPVASAYIVDEEKTKYDSPFNSGIPSAIEEAQIMMRNPTGTSDPTKVKVNYVKQPAKVLLDPNNSSNNVDCDLPTEVHRDIVKLAVNNIFQSLSGPQSQPEE
jgi:hypothetical protein